MFRPITNTKFNECVGGGIVERQKEFVERKEQNLKNLESQVSCRFRPERVSRSRLEREGGNLGEKLY